MMRNTKTGCASGTFNLPRAVKPLAFLWALACGAAFAAEAVEEAHVPYPLEQWAMRDVISDAELSPDGTRLAIMQIPSRDGDPIVEVYDTADLAKTPFRLNADPMEIQFFTWINDEQIVFGARQMVRDQVKRERDAYSYKVGLLNLKTKKVQNFADQGSVGIASLLPKQPNKLILSVTTPTQTKVSSLARRVQRVLTPRDYYEFDLVKGTKKLLVQGRRAIGGYRFDPEGRLWYATGSDIDERQIRWMWRPPGESEWVEFHRQGWDSYEFQPFNVFALDDTLPNHAFVRARNGHDTHGLWSFDMENKRFAELIYRRADVDISGVRYHSNSWEFPGRVVGVVYNTDRTYVEFFDEAEEALYKQLEGIIPYAHNLDVLSRSRDGATMVISNQGPRDPGTYYLLKDGKLQSIGSQQPLFASEDLADAELVQYKARDGRRLFAYVTVPKGEPPFPLINLPHGGPQARDFSGYDKWAQLLANYGYLVVQPQFRGSDGFGRALREAAFEDGSQRGFKMQDDKDDAALYLVEQGLADKDRMAMFGWSYGGYATAVAAARTPQLYQCTIAGAAVFDTVLQWRYDRRGMDGEVLDRYLAYEEAGVDPIDEVEKVNVPMLVVHGVVDSRVLVDHATRYVKLLEKHEKPHKYVRLEGAGHFYSTLLYDHQLEFFNAMIDFLRNDCGPDGL